MCIEALVVGARHSAHAMGVGGESGKSPLPGQISGRIERHGPERDNPVSAEGIRGGTARAGDRDMTDYGPLKLHVPEPAVRPGGSARLFECARFRGPARSRARRWMLIRKPSATSPIPSSACSTATGRRSAPGPASWTETLAVRPARHDDSARLRRAHADGAAAGQDVVLHAAHGRGGGQLRLPQGAAPGRHELSDLSPGRTADRRRLSAGRHDVPDLFQRGTIR